MHEAGAVQRALAARFDPPGSGPIPDRVRVVIRDPLRVDPGFVRLIATELLRDRGVVDPRVTVEAATVTCPECGAIGRPSPADPACATCGLPFRSLSGPSIVVEPEG